MKKKMIWKREEGGGGDITHTLCVFSNFPRLSFYAQIFFRKSQIKYIQVKWVCLLPKKFQSHSRNESKN